MPISGGSALTPKAIRDYIFGEDMIKDLNWIAGAVPDAGTMPAGGTLFDGFATLNIVVGAVNQWAGIDYAQLVLVHGYRFKCGPNTQPTLGRYRLRYLDPGVVIPTWIDYVTEIPATNDAWSPYVRLPTPILAREHRLECTTYHVDADLLQEVELRGFVYE